jgi:uncharacterized membrane protein
MEGAIVPLLLLCFLIGCVTGLRSLTGPAVVSWGARLGWLNFAGTKLAFLSSSAAVVIFTVLALAELVADKLPNTPPRTAPLGLIPRILLGSCCAIALATSAGGSVLIAALLGVAGALVGTYGGYNLRRTLVSKSHLPDLVVAFAEDAVAIAAGLLIVSHV